MDRIYRNKIYVLNGKFIRFVEGTYDRLCSDGFYTYVKLENYKGVNHMDYRSYETILLSKEKVRNGNIRPANQKELNSIKLLYG